MDDEITVETLPLLGVCNLCLKEGIVKSMLLSQTYNGSNELYTAMLLKCYCIDITALELGDTKRLICMACIKKLREAVQFRDQVEASLKVLVDNMKAQNLRPIIDDIKSEGSNDIDDDDFVSLTGGKEMVLRPILDDIKDEGSNNVLNDNDYDDFGDEEDNMVLKEFKVKSEPLKEENRRKKRKTITSKMKLKLKSKEFKPKKVDLSETEAMLERGLFPFKIRKNSIFTCAICPEKSTNLDDIKTHIKDHNKTNVHLAFKKMMFSHYQRFYKTSTKLRCKICTTDVEHYDQLKQHLENCGQLKYSRNWNTLPFKLEKDQLDCPVCNKTFLNYVNLNNHMNVHYPNYICENCGKAFASKARLRGHMRTHEVGNFPCRHCDAVFDRVTKRENHVSKEHKSGVRYACKRCKISLPSFYARQKHLAEVHNEELKRYKCKVCPQSYITPGHLSSHVRRDHLNERNHKCDKCDLAFYTKNALKMHMIKHDGERIHVCHICQKSYQRKKTLREHMRIHNNDKRFVCPVCGRAFTQKCTLKGHLKVHERKVDIDDRIVQPLHSI